MFMQIKQISKLFQGEYVFYTVFSVGIFVFLAIILLNSNFTTMNPEAVVAMPKIFENGTKLLPEDFSRALDSRIFEYGRSRTRFIPTLFYIINLKFRIWLLGFFPLPAGLSLTWVVIFIFCVVLLFRLMLNLTDSYLASWIAVLLFLVSPGCLSNTVHFCQPSKPLAIFFTITSLYLASQVCRRVKEKDFFNKADSGVFILLLAVIFLSFFVDETCWFIPVWVRLLFPDLFKKRRYSNLIISSYYSIIALFVFTVTFVIPGVIAKFNFFPYNFWESIFTETPSITTATTYVNFITSKSGQLFTWARQCRVTNFLLNGFYLFANHINPFKADTSRNFFRVDIYYFLSFFFYAIFLYRRYLDKSEKTLFKRLALLLILFVALHSIIHLRHMIITTDIFPYGSLFSVFFVIFISILLSKKEGALRYINKIALVFFITVFISNFYRTNIKMGYAISEDYRGWFPRETGGMPLNKELTYLMVREAWKNRFDKRILADLKKSYPVKSYWLFVELDYLNKQIESPRTKVRGFIPSRKNTIPFIPRG